MNAQDSLATANSYCLPTLPFAALILFSLALIWPFPAFFYADDLFYGSWAAHFGATGTHWNPLLARQFPHLDEYLIYPPLHMVVAGWFFKLAGFSDLSVRIYTALCFCIATYGLLIVFNRLALSAVSIAGVPLVLVAFSFIGLRPELTGAPLLLIGLALLLDDSVWRARVGRCLIVIAPLAAPSMLALSAALLIVFSFADLVTRRSLLPMLEGLFAALIGLLVLGALIGFRFVDFAAQTAYHHTRLPPAVMFDADGSMRALACFTGCYAIHRWTSYRKAALLIFAIGLGFTLALFLHLRAAAEMIMTGMALLIGVLVLLPRESCKKISAVGLMLVQIALVGNLLAFWLFSIRDPALDTKTRALVAALANEGRAIIVDEVAARYLYDYKALDKLGWTWILPFPDYRPAHLSALQQGDLWVISRHSLLGYLRGQTPLAAPLATDIVPHKVLPGIPCFLGRNSCRLPVRQFDYVLFWRGADGGVLVQDMVAENAPRRLP
jgi:hypothetical protein